MDENENKQESEEPAADQEKGSSFNAETLDGFTGVDTHPRSSKAPRSLDRSEVVLEDEAVAVMNDIEELEACKAAFEDYLTCAREDENLVREVLWQYMRSADRRESPGRDPESADTQLFEWTLRTFHPANMVQEDLINSYRDLRRYTQLLAERLRWTEDQLRIHYNQVHAWARSMLKGHVEERDNWLTPSSTLLVRLPPPVDTTEGILEQIKSGEFQNRNEPGAVSEEELAQIDARGRFWRARAELDEAKVVLAAHFHPLNYPLHVAEYSERVAAGEQGLPTENEHILLIGAQRTRELASAMQEYSDAATAAHALRAIPSEQLTSRFDSRSGTNPSSPNEVGGPGMHQDNDRIPDWISEVSGFGDFDTIVWSEPDSSEGSLETEPSFFIEPGYSPPIFKDPTNRAVRRLGKWDTLKKQHASSIMDLWRSEDWVADRGSQPQPDALIVGRKRKRRAGRDTSEAAKHPDVEQDAIEHVDEARSESVDAEEEDDREHDINRPDTPAEAIEQVARPRKRLRSWRRRGCNLM